MSTSNKLFTGSVLAAAFMTLAHTGVWAWHSAQSIDAAQKNQIAPVIAMASNGSSAFQSPLAGDPCAKAAHASAR
jgi:hypothetical protein